MNILRRLTVAFAYGLTFFLAAPAVVFIGYVFGVGLVTIARGH